MGANKLYNKVLIGCVVTSTVLFALMIFFNIASSQQSWGIFQNKVGDAAGDVAISPAGFTFSTWVVIYIWTALLLVFNIILIFIKQNDERLYAEPPVLTIPFHILLQLNFAGNFSWLFINDAKLSTVGWVMLTFMVVTLYGAIIIATRNTFNAVSALQNKKWVYWLYRILALNGLTFYAAWITVASLLNLAIAITYEWAPSDLQNDYMETSSIIVLCLLTVVLVAYFAIDIYFFEKYTRYTWSSYIQLIFSFAGILGKNWNGGQEASEIISLSLAIVVGIMFITKIIVTLYKHCTEKRD